MNDVLSGRADVGVVRTDTLERMTKEGTSSTFPWSRPFTPGATPNFPCCSAPGWYPNGRYRSLSMSLKHWPRMWPRPCWICRPVTRPPSTRALSVGPSPKTTRSSTTSCKPCACRPTTAPPDSNCSPCWMRTGTGPYSPSW
ncbi:MAG: hypothetical protein B0D96_01310 [Candidatus Sedimenticola endophacoides]|nr:MAG: hypothetical protein B0D94_04515 [Candidatus Sedimenticola endophacoides]OQX37754.1 MAG: hypothetical protein B0D96_01310 [Candidatus Sedimenticola endophacoides]OQX38989.1 MAG: hypothetical protein B0D89_11665 [Candidatus Sedimenticola endophacoides]OQX46372.1 MAG: hypothetical protein B0D90_01210 [Candidatus Sedimenticola endophacoides]OQX47296.1 MAG: hypothetical protein B0D85_01765 [Candidatus Sedimenticola endophacoides]